eukprot:scaffold6192_cov68-Attheya_sp.AAC.4
MATQRQIQRSFLDALDHGSPGDDGAHINESPAVWCIVTVSSCLSFFWNLKVMETEKDTQTQGLSWETMAFRFKKLILRMQRSLV